MDGYVAGAMAAVWLGVLTSISPCPMATNVAAVAFIGKQVGSPRRVIMAGLTYTVGRMIAYFLVSVVIVASLLSVPVLAQALQKYMNLALGPLLIVVGMLLLNVIRIPMFNRGIDLSRSSKFTRPGFVGALVLGAVFALSFCPVSAGLFFGSLLPLSARQQSPVLYPLLYGIGTGAPVILFAFVVAFSVESAGRVFNKLAAIERVVRIVTAAVFLAVGLYFVLIYLCGLSLF